MNELFIKNRAAFCHWTQKPENNADFGFIVKWEPGQKHISECLNELKTSHCDPMHHPSLQRQSKKKKEKMKLQSKIQRFDVSSYHIFLHIFRADCFVTAVGWIKDAKN